MRGERSVETGSTITLRSWPGRAAFGIRNPHTVYFPFRQCRQFASNVSASTWKIVGYGDIAFRLPYFR